MIKLQRFTNHRIMKKVILAAASILLIMNSCSNKEESGYIGPSQITIENGVMTPETLLAFGRLSDPRMSPDGKTILYGVSYTSIEKNKSCRNLFVCDPDGSNKRQLTRYAKSVSAAKWSKDGSSIFFLQGGQLYKTAYRNGKLGGKVQLSNVPAGISDYSISPDEEKLYYVSTIPGPVKGPKDTNPSLDKAQAYVAEGLMYRHWDHWVTETPRTFVSPLNGGTITPENSFDIIAGEKEGIELPTEPFGGAEQLCWAPDSRHIAYSCRKLTGKEYAFSTNTCIFIYDILTGNTQAVTTSGGYDTDPSWSPDGKHLAWISMERDGYEADRQRIMIADTHFSENHGDGQTDNCSISNIREITVGFDADATGLFWAKEGKRLVFPATTEGLGALFAADRLDDNNCISRITFTDWQYGFGTPFAWIDDNIYTTYQSMEFPTELVKIDLGNSALVRITHENEHILSQLNGIRQDSINIPLPNGEELHCWILRPRNYDPSKKLPGIEMLNGGPQTSLDQSWSYRWNFRLMAEQGYAVILPNRHGDSGFGQAWKEQISGDYQGLNMQDYLEAGKWFKQQNWAGKLAAVGASYGGFSAYNLMGMHDGLFDCFIAHAGIFNEKMLWYTTEEAWFGNWDNGGLTQYAYQPGQVGPKGDGMTFGGMQQAGAPYAANAKVREHYGNDPEAKVTKWNTPILCIHGMMDYRIPYEQGMAAFNAAQMMGVPSKLIIFPEENHWILQPQNSLFWHTEFYGWLEKWVK